MITPTTITTEDQIYLARSPINIKLQNLAKDTTIQKASLYLYIWTGNLNTPPVVENYTFVSSKVSKNDDYINFQTAEVIQSHIDNSRAVWVSGDNPPSIANEGVFWQYRYVIDSEAEIMSVTNFATNGYRYDFEQKGSISNETNEQPYLNLEPISYARNYTPELKYYKRNFVYTNTLAACTTENMISSIENTDPKNSCYLGDKYLIMYVNRIGLWDTFTPLGKVVKQTDITAKASLKAFRDPLSLDNNTIHTTQRKLEDSKQKITLNTGGLTENMALQVEDLILSNLIYLVEFNGETFETVQIGLTVDSTAVTVDSTIYTVDNQTVTITDIGFLSTFRQIPVTNSNNNFTLKTRLNDKGKINYTLEFEVSTSRINNTR